MDNWGSCGAVSASSAYGTSTTKIASALEGELSAAERRLDSLDKSVECACARLSPLVRPMPGANAKGPDLIREQLSPVSERVRTLSDRLERLAVRLDCLVGSLDI